METNSDSSVTETWLDQSPLRTLEKYPPFNFPKCIYNVSVLHMYHMYTNDKFILLCMVKLAQLHILFKGPYYKYFFDEVEK